jgi:hypothetical protein
VILDKPQFREFPFKKNIILLYYTQGRFSGSLNGGGTMNGAFPLSSGPPGDGTLGVLGVPGTLVGGPGGTFGLSEFGAALTTPNNTIPIISIRTKAFINFSPHRNFLA